MSNNVIGTCGNCGGPVVMPSMMVNPVACCASCGATARHGHGPVVPMNQPRRVSVDEALRETDSQKTYSRFGR